MNPVVHFELPSDDRQRMADFYTTAFGWQMQMYGEEMGNYVVVTACETDENGRPKMAGTINGGFYPRQKDAPAQYPSVVIAVDDISEAMQKVTDAGGNVQGEPSQIPNVGWYVSFIDTEGNRLSLLQPVIG